MLQDTGLSCTQFLGPDGYMLMTVSMVDTSRPEMRLYGKVANAWEGYFGILCRRFGKIDLSHPVDVNRGQPNAFVEASRAECRAMCFLV
jgi:hypothetical protein